eukprot:scaffold32260_cov40-Attheya_sp.AAC.1
MTPEKQLIYEMLVRASAHVYVSKREMNLKILFDVIKDCTTDLKRAKLAKERINDPMVEDLVSVVAQVSANDVLVEGDVGDGEFASFTQRTLDETEVVDTVESESSTILNDGTK